MFRPLILHHQAFRDIAARLRDLHAHDSIEDVQLIGTCRRALNLLASDHIAAEQAVVIDVLAIDPRTGIRGLARPLRDRLDVLVADFAAHQQRWPLDLISAGWQLFCDESGALLDRMISQMDWEERELYPAFAHIALTRPDQRPLRQIH